MTEPTPITPVPHPRLTVAVIVLTYNEAPRVEDCLKSAAWADELIVVDGGSTDGTLEIARRYTPLVYESDLLGPKNPGGFAAQRNFALGKATSDWIFYVDADERITPELGKNLTAKLATPEGETTASYMVKRKEYLFGVYTPYTCGDSWFTRIFRRGRAQWDNRLVHEELEVNGEIHKLEGDLLHFSKDSLAPYVAPQNRHTTLDAEQAILDGGKLSTTPLLPMLKAFANTYIYKQGYKEGAFGLIMAFLFMQYSFLTWAKRWEQEMKEGKYKSTEPKAAILESLAALLSKCWRLVSPPR